MDAHESEQLGREPKPAARVQRVVRFWQNALRLNDWRVTLREASDKELEGRNAFVELLPTVREAVVSLRTVRKLDQALEEDMLHELLHLTFWQPSVLFRKMDDDSTIPFEQGLNSVAHVLVTMRLAFCGGARVQAKRE